MNKSSFIALRLEVDLQILGNVKEDGAYISEEHFQFLSLL